MTNKTELSVITSSKTEMVQVIEGGHVAVIKQIVEDGNVDPILGYFEDRLQGLLAENLDPNNKKDRERMRSFASSISKSKKPITGMAADVRLEVESKAQHYLDTIANVKSESKRFENRMNEIRDIAKGPAVEWDNNEKIRIQAHTDKIAQMKSQVTSVNEFGESLPSSTLINVLGKFEVFKAEKLNAEHCEEFLSEYEQLVNDAIDKFNNEFVLQAKKREQDEAELQALREKQAQQEAQELADKRERAAKLKAEQDLADEKERNKQREAQLIMDNIHAEALLENQQFDAARKLEQDKIDAENREKQAAIDAENAEKKRLADVETARVNAEKEMLAKQAEEKRIADEKAANHEHQRKINRGALDSMVAEGYSEDEAKAFLKLIIGKKIKNVSVNY